jgi:hypothetical protein
MTCTWLRTGGHVLFTLDDPYIDLALAERLSNGFHYGLNAGEAASPASSILFPFLLVPFVKLGLGEIGAAALCALGIVLASGCFAAILLEIGVKLDDLTIAARVVLSAAFALVFNFVGLASTGLEHGLHLAACLGCVLGLVRFLKTGRVGWLLPACALAAPLLRYEGASLWIACVGVLAWNRRFAPATLLFAVGTLAIGGFSLFLHLRGLPWLPTSVLAKTVMLQSRSAADIAQAAQDVCRVNAVCFCLGGLVVLYGRFYRLAALMLGMAATGLMAAAAAMAFGIPAQPQAGLIPLVAWRVMVDALSTYGFAQLAFLGLLIGWGGLAGIRARQTARVQLAACGRVVVAAHMIAGKFGWFARYEIYALTSAAAFAACVHAQVCARWSAHASVRGIAALCACSLALMCLYALRITSVPAAALNIFDQQYQMHRFATEFHRGPVAVNDLGQVSFRNPDYVLDLLGLGSADALAARAAGQGPAWIDRLATAHRVHYAMIYPQNFARLPPSWVPVGRLVMDDPVISSSYPDVTFFAVSAMDVSPLRRDMLAFASTLPPHDRLLFDEASTSPR